MIIIESNYSCSLRKITFKSIVESLKIVESSKQYQTPTWCHDEVSITFVDGDSANIYSVVRSVYELRKNCKVAYMITLLSKDKECSSVIRHLSDYVIDKKVSYIELQNLIATMIASRPKVLEDNVFGDVWGDICSGTLNLAT